jgi:hypothetical protein
MFGKLENGMLVMGKRICFPNDKTLKYLSLVGHIGLNL